MMTRRRRPVLDNELCQFLCLDANPLVGPAVACLLQRITDALVRRGDLIIEGLEEGAQQTLTQIDRALAKLEDGSYGTCERCGKPIGEERLRARPWATLCIDDQRLADRG